MRFGESLRRAVLFVVALRYVNALYCAGGGNGLRIEEINQPTLWRTERQFLQSVRLA